MKRHIYSKASYEAMRLLYTYTKAVVAVVGYNPNILRNCVQGIVWDEKTVIAKPQAFFLSLRRLLSLITDSEIVVLLHDLSLCMYCSRELPCSRLHVSHVSMSYAAYIPPGQISLGGSHHVAILYTTSHHSPRSIPAPIAEITRSYTSLD